MKKIALLLLFGVCFSAKAQNNIGIGTTSPDASAALEIKSTDKGLLIPRMDSTARNAIPNPATGLMVYDNSTNSFYYFDGVIWNNLKDIETLSSISDADNDTKIQVEETADEDIIRFTMAGTEYLKLDSGRMEILNTGSSVFIGEGAGANDDYTDNQNVGIGTRAINANTTNGFWNTAIGYEAMKDNTSGRYNTATGHMSLQKIKDGTFNSAYGSGALSTNQSGSSNSAFGANALRDNIAGSNTAIGTAAALKNVTGSHNTFVGHLAGAYKDGGSQNVVIGYLAGAATSNLSPSNNVMIGYQSGYNNNGVGNIFLGYNSGKNETGSNLLIIENSDTDSANALIYGEFDNNFLAINGTLRVNDGSQANGYVLTSDSGGNSSWQPSTSLVWGVDTNGTGVYSLLNSGSPNLASGTSSFAVGNGNTANGSRSIAMGYNNIASGHNSIASCYASEASGFSSVALGNSTIANGHQAVAMGNGSVATGNQAVAIGNSPEAHGYSSVAMGNGTEAIGSRSVAMGNDSEAQGYSSFAIGNSPIASGYGAVAMGDHTKAQAHSSTAIGRYNSGGGSETIWVPSDPLFMVGNGSSSADTSNAMTILKNGNTGLGTETPDTTLHVMGKIKYQDGTQANGHVLTSDADGNASWQLPLANSDNQTLTLNANSLTIQNANSVDLSPFLDNTDDQNLTLSGSTLSIEDGNSVDLGTGFIENRSPDNSEVEGQSANIDLVGTIETNQLRTFGNVTLGSVNDPSPNTVTVNSNLKVGESGSVLTDIIKLSINRDVGNMNGNSTTIETFNVTGAQTGAVVYVSPSSNLGNQIVIGQAWVSSAGVVSVKLRNTDGGGQNPPQMDYNIVVIN